MSSKVFLSFSANLETHSVSLFYVYFQVDYLLYRFWFHGLNSSGKHTAIHSIYYVTTKWSSVCTKKSPKWQWNFAPNMIVRMNSAVCQTRCALTWIRSRVIQRVKMQSLWPIQVRSFFLENIPSSRGDSKGTWKLKRGLHSGSHFETFYWVLLLFWFHL